MKDYTARVTGSEGRQSPSTFRRGKRRPRATEKRSTTLEPLPPPPPPPPASDSSPESAGSLQRCDGSPALPDGQRNADDEERCWCPGSTKSPGDLLGTNELSCMSAELSSCQSAANEAFQEKIQSSVAAREAGEKRAVSCKASARQPAVISLAQRAAAVHLVSFKPLESRNRQTSDVSVEDSSQPPQKRPTSLFKPGQKATFFEDYKSPSLPLMRVNHSSGRPSGLQDADNKEVMSGGQQRFRIQQKRRPLPSIPPESGQRRDVGVMTPEEMFPSRGGFPVTVGNKLTTSTPSLENSPTKPSTWKHVQPPSKAMGTKCKLFLLIPAIIFTATIALMTLFLLGFIGGKKTVATDEMTTPGSRQKSTDRLHVSPPIGNSTFNESEHIATHRPASNPTSSNSSEKNAEDSVTQPISKDTENSSRRRNNRKHRNNKEVTTVQPAQPADHRTEAEASIPSESGGRKEMNKNTSRRRGGRRKSNNKHRRNKKPENRSKSRDKTRKTKNSPKRKSNKNNKKKKIKSSNNNRKSQERQRTSAGNRARSLEPEHWSHIAPIFSPSEKDEVKHGFGEVRDQDQLSSSFNRPSDDDSYDDAGSAEWRTDDEDSFGNETSNGKAKAESNVFVRARNSVSRSPRRCIPVTNPICDAVLPYRTTFVKAQHDIKRMAMTSLVSSVVRSNRTTCDQESAVRFDCALRYPKCEEEKGSQILRELPCRRWCTSLVTSCLDTTSANLVRAIRYADRTGSANDQSVSELEATERQEVAQQRNAPSSDFPELASYACDVALRDDVIEIASIDNTCMDLQTIQRFFSNRESNGTNTKTAPSCDKGEFQCLDERCIDARWRCDGINDCGSMEDEIDCACSYGEFQCASGQCIDQTRSCDGYHDCVDRSDEINCASCAPNLKSCENGQCIPTAWWCDGDVDCDNSVDEAQCDCAARGLVSCGNFSCVPARYRCDGEEDCEGGVDEKGCHQEENQSCPMWSMLCDNACIPVTKRCDGVQDCVDASDEANCGTCQDISLDACHGLQYNVTMMPNFLGHSSQLETARSSDYVMFATMLVTRCHPQFSSLACSVFVPPAGNAVCAKDRMTSQRLLPCRSFCNKIRSACLSVHHSASFVWPKFLDCSNFPRPSIETDCYEPRSSKKELCAVDHFRCNSTDDEDAKCVPATSRCDGIKHCDDGSDEAGCACDGSQRYKCLSTNKCIPLSWQCDTHIDCEDESDERNCSKCTVEEMTCSDYSCVSKQLWCDGNRDCDDGSDERDCVRLVSRSKLLQAVDPEEKSRIRGVLVGYNRGMSQWQPVCAQPWNALMSHLACSQMGFREALSFSRISPRSPFLRRSMSNHRVLVTSGSSHVRTVQEIFMQSASSCRSKRIIRIVCKPSMCGRRSDKTDRGEIVTRILGGRTSRDHAWPWLASLSLPGMSHVCGATLVHRQWLISAAHCFQERTDARIWVARINMNGENSLRTSTPFNVSRILMHPRYNPQAVDFDLALVKLATPVDKTQEALCLPSSPFDAGAFCVIAGWGVNGRTRGGAQKLQEGSVHIVTRESCQSYYPNHVITDRMVCAGNAGTVDACSGDSGGPLMCWQSDTMQWQLSGVTSWGSSCKPHSAPGVYTDIRYFARWARAAMDEKGFG